MSLSKFLLAVSVVALPLSGLSAADAPAAKKKADGKAAVAKTTAYKVDPSASAIKWTGKKVTGQHNGTVAIKEGDVRVADGSIVGGNFVVDMTTIVDDDLSGDSKAKLEGHLKSDDFFGVEAHPAAAFEITKVAPAKSGDATHMVSGNLTIKGKTHPLSFPAKVTVGSDQVTAEADGVEVDRTLYDVRYGSGKFFQNLGDKAINDKFWLDISLVAKK